MGQSLVVLFGRQFVFHRDEKGIYFILFPFCNVSCGNLLGYDFFFWVICGSSLVEAAFEGLSMESWWQLHCARCHSTDEWLSTESRGEIRLLELYTACDAIVCSLVKCLGCSLFWTSVSWIVRYKPDPRYFMTATFPVDVEGCAACLSSSLRSDKAALEMEQMWSCGAGLSGLSTKGVTRQRSPDEVWLHQPLPLLHRGKFVELPLCWKFCGSVFTEIFGQDQVQGRQQQMCLRSWLSLPSGKPICFHCTILYNHHIQMVFIELEDIQKLSHWRAQYTATWQFIYMVFNMSAWAQQSTIA